MYNCIRLNHVLRRSTRNLSGRCTLNPMVHYFQIRHHSIMIPTALGTQMCRDTMEDTTAVQVVINDGSKAEKQLYMQ